MKKLVLSALVAGVGLTATAGSAFGAQPANPGCFGRDRAAYIHDVALTDASGPGASEVGVILSGRAGDNGTINQAYKDACGG